MIRTPHYKIPYFTDGELFSALLDQERAVALDLMLKGLSNLTGDGIIEGWEISEDSGLDIAITPGKGIISGFYGVTQNNTSKTLSDDATNYVYATRNSNITDGISTSSNKLQVSFVDTDVPAAPSSLQIDSQGDRTVTLTWDKSTEADVSYYKVYRKLSGDITYVFISNADHLATDGLSDVTYIDTSLVPETEYDYRVSTVDLSGNESLFSLVSAETDPDTTPASEVTNVRMATANKSVSLTWDASSSDDLDSYIIVLSRLDSSGEIISTSTVNVSTRLYYFNNALLNNVTYRVIIKTLDTYGNVSEGIIKDFTPQQKQAPEEVSAFGYTVTNARSPEPITPEVVFSWDASASTDVSHYNLYIYDEGVISETILVGDNLSKTMISFPFRDGQVLVSKMFGDGRDYEVRLTVVDSNSSESDGIFIKISIPDYSAPPEVKNITASSGDSYASFAWEASDVKDFSNYELYRWDASTESTFSETIDYTAFSGNTFTILPIVGTYPVGSWVELTQSPSGGGKSVKLSLATALNPGDTLMVCDYIPTYFDENASILITNPPTPTTLTQRETYRDTGLTNGTTYRYVFRTVDEDDNKSDGIMLSVTPDEDAIDLESPLTIVPKSRDREIQLSWSRVSFAGGYKVYRAGPFDSYTAQAIEGDFALIATVAGNENTSLFDIGLLNDRRYAYVVTSYLASSESDFDAGDQVIGTPIAMNVPNPPENLSATVISGQVNLSWDPPSDITGIEGWNVYRYTQKYGLFELISSLPFTTLVYNDVGLVDGETYYYVVRSFSNTIDITTSISSSIPPLSILIGQVVTQLGAVTSITSQRTIVSNLESVVSALTSSFLVNHKHSVDVDDEFSETRKQALKINLSNEEDITVFTTIDYQNYVSERTLADYGSYIVYVNDQIPNLLYEVDFDENSIVFEKALYSEEGSSPYSEPPIVRLQFVNLKEISGQLNSRFIADLDASKIVSGILEKAILPSISHRGRIQELASVRTYALLSDDNIYFDLNNITYVVDDENVNIELGTPTVFYDFFEYGGVLYGASSKGILKSSDYGITWEDHVSFTDLARRFYAKQVAGTIIYFAVCRRKIYYTSDGESWFVMSGLDASSIIHDLAEDATGNIYAATDTGVSIYDLEFASQHKFNAASIIKSESTSSEVISALSLGSSGILVTTSEGVFKTSDLGVTWSKYSSTGPLYGLSRWSSTKILATNESGYVVETEDNGENWSTNLNLTGIDRDQIFKIIDDRLFFTTSEGIFYTDDLETIYEINGEFKKRLSKSHLRALYGITKDNILLSFDNKLYRWKDGRTTLWSEFVGTIPSIFLNDVLVNNGYYYNVINNDLYFEWKKSYDDVNTIAVSYGEYILPGGGWQDIDADDIEVSLYVNGAFLGTATSVGLDEDYIVRDEDTEEILNKKYEFAYAGQRKLTIYSSNGKVYVTGAILSKFDVIHVSVENVTFTEEGSNTHDEIDDALSRRDVGLPYGLGNAYLDGMLQMGLHAEHNFIESIQTNTQYPYASTRAIRSFNSELINADHFIFGKKFYDVFNSTIDYVAASKNKTLDPSPFVVKDFYEVGDETWVATDRNIFALASDRQSIDREIVISSSADISVASVKVIGSSIYVVGSNGIYVSADSGATWTKNGGYGLPGKVYQINNVFNVLVAGCSDGVYYTSFDSETWTKADFYDADAEAVVITKQVSSIVVPGTAYCLIDNIVYKSLNGVTWRQAYTFDSLGVTDLVADRLFPYNNNVFALTNKGLYNDIGSLNNAASNVTFILIEIDSTDSVISTKDFAHAGNRIVILAEKNTIYRSENSGTTWAKQTISAVDFADLSHIWKRIQITDALITQMNVIGIPTTVTDKLASIKDVVYGTEAVLSAAMQSILTTVEYNNYSDVIVQNSSYPYDDTEIISSLADLYVRETDLSFSYGTTTARADRAYLDTLKQPALGTSNFEKVSVYLSPSSITGEGYSISLSVYGADASNNIVTGIISADAKSSSDFYGPGWYNFRIYYPGGYDRVMLVLTQNYGDNNNGVKWNYSVPSSGYGAINDSGTQTYTYNYVLWQFDDASDTTNLRVLSDPADQLSTTPAIGTGDFYQTEFEDAKVKLALDSRVLAFLVDQSGSLTWNDYDGSRFDLVRQFASDLNNIYPGVLHYALASYGSKIIDTLELERVTEGTDSLYGGTYRIVRKTSGYPVTPIDGSIIANTGLTVAADDTVVNGTTYYYSIFNMRDDDVYSLAKNASITVNSRSVPLPVSGLTLDEVVEKETIGTPATLLDTGKRKVIITFRTIQGYASYYNAVRIVRKECYQDVDMINDTSSNAPEDASKKYSLEDDSIASPSDGTVVYEGAITSGENIVIDDFGGTNDPNNGTKYYYAIYTKNATGNYCLPQNALQGSIRISSVWRGWMYDPTYNATHIPTEFLVSPSDVTDFTIEAGNTQNKISWTLPVSDTAVGVMLYVSKVETPDIDPLAAAHLDAEPPTDSSYSSSSDSTNTPGILIYQGTDGYFVHRELENDRRYYYRLYTFDRVKTISAGYTKGEAIPLDSITDEFEPPTAKNFYTEIFNDEKIILRWGRNSYYEKQTNYFSDSVVARSYAYDESGAPISEIEDFDFVIDYARFGPKGSLEFDGGGDNDPVDMTLSDYSMLEDKSSYDGEIRASFALVDALNPGRLSNYLTANFNITSQYKVYDADLLAQNEESPEKTQEEAGVDEALYTEGLTPQTSAEALEFSLESEALQFTMENPLLVSVKNKYPETQMVAQKETVSDGYGGSTTQIVYYDGVYAKSGMSYYGDVEISFQKDALEDDDVVSVSAEVYELSHRVRVKGGGFRRVWKQTPSETFTLESKTIGITNEERKAQVSDESGNTSSDRDVTLSVGVFRLLPPELAGELNILVTTTVNGYRDRTEHFLLLKTMLNIDIEARAPIADGRDVAEQFSNIYIGPPKFDARSKITRRPVPDGTLVKWEIEKGSFGQDRPFYSSESVPLQDGIYSTIRRGIARNVFFGPASDVKKHWIQDEDGQPKLVGELYTIKVSSVYDGMFGSADEEIEISPLETTGTSYRFFMTNGYEMAGHSIYADGATSTNFEIHADPLATGGDGGQTFYDCLDLGDMPYIPLLEGQLIELQSPSFGSVKEEESDISYTYNGTTYDNPEDIPVEIASGRADFSVSINAFVGPPPKTKAEPPSEPSFAKCYLHGRVPAETAYPPVVSFSGQTQMIFGGKSITMLGGGSRTSGIPPVVIVLREPLEIYLQKMMSRSSVVLSPPNDGINTTTIYFETSFSGETVPDGTQITFSFVFSKGDAELTLEEIDDLSEKEKRTLFAGFSSYEEFISEINLQSYNGITSTVDGKSVVSCVLNPTRIRTDAIVKVRATTTYDKLGTVERSMSADAELKFIGTEDGEGGSSVYLKKVERYEPTGDTWEEIDPMLVGRVGTACEYDPTTEKTFVIGGLTETGIAVSCEMFEYDRVDKSALDGVYGEWSYIEELTYGRAFAQSAIHSGKIYVLGGFGWNPFSGQSSANSHVLCEVYDIATDTWSVIDDMPHPVSHGCAELIGDNIYVFSGLSSLKPNGKGHAIDTFNNYLMKYNITAGTWTTIDTLDEVSNVLMRVSPASYVKSGKLYIFGGILNEYEDSSYEDALFLSSLVEIDVSDENNIVYTTISYSNTPIERFRAGAYALLNDKFYMAGGSGVKQYFDGTITRTYHSNTLRATECYDTTTDTWTTYRNLGKMTYERHSLGSTDDTEYFYAIGGGGSGYLPGKLLITIDLSPDEMKADGKTQVSAAINLADATGEPPEDGIKLLMRGYVLVSVPAESEGVEADITSASTDDSTNSKAETGTVSDMSNRVSIYPVLFSALTLYSISGSAGTILLERGEDILVALQDLIQYIDGDDTVIGIVYNEKEKKIKVPPKKALEIELGVKRNLYKIVVEVTIEDDFYFGRTDTEKTLASNMTGFLEEGSTGLLPGQTRDEDTGEIVENPDYVESSDDSGGSLTAPEAAEQEASPTVQVYNNMAWIPYIDDTYEIMTYSEFSDELDLLSQQIPFGGSPHWDGIIDFSQNVLKNDDELLIEKFMVDVSDNEENLSKSTLDDAIDQIHLVDGYQKLPVFTNLFVTSFPPSLSARKGQTEVVDLERLAGETKGLSHTIIDESYIDPIVQKIKTGSVGAIGRGTYAQVVDFGQLIHVISLESVFELYSYTNGWIEIFTSLDGYSYEAAGIIFEPDVSTAVNLTTRYVKFVVTLSSEFGNASLSIPVPPPAFLSINFIYSEPNRQYIYTYAHDMASYIREIYLTMNGTLPSTSDVNLGYTSSNSVIWDDYQRDAQPSVSQNGRITTVNSTMSLLNLVSASSVGGNTPLTYKTYEEIMESFKQTQQNEYGKVVDNIIILEYHTATDDGSSKVVFADSTTVTIDEAPDFSNAIDFSTIDGQDPTKDSTSGTILNYDFLYSEDGYLFESRYGRWQPDAAVNVYRNGIFVDPSEYVVIRSKGVVKFFNRQRLTSNYAIEVGLSPQYRVGLEVINRDSVDYAVLDEFAYMYNTNFVKSKDYNNSIPVATGLNVTPVNAKASSTFTANYIYGDGNNDVEKDSEIQWYINGGIMPELKNTITWSASDLIKNNLKDGDRIFFTVKPSDGKVFGALASSTTAHIGDTPPTITGLQFAYTSNGVVSATPKSDVDIYIQYTYYDTQGRAESGTTFEWFVDGVSINYNVEDQSVFKNNTTDSDGELIINAGSVLKARVTPSNGIIKGTPYETDEIVILNSAPYISGVALTPTSPDENSVLIVGYAYGDRDEDEDVTEIRWFKNGEAVTAINDSSQVNASYLTSGDSWYAELTPYDGQDRGTLVRTSTVTIS